MTTIHNLWKEILRISTVMKPSLKLTFSHLNMDGWKTSFLFEMAKPGRCELLLSGSVTMHSKVPPFSSYVSQPEFPTTAVLSSDGQFVLCVGSFLK